MRKELQTAQRQIKNAFGCDAIKVSQNLLRNVKLLTVGFGALGAMSVKMSAEIQQTRAALVTLTRSADTADKLLKEIKTFAATTPFEFKGLAKASQQMIAFGFEAKAVVPILNAVGDAVSGLGGSQENMDSIVRVLGQIQTKGKVTAKEIMQLSQQGINAWQYLADAANVSVAEIQKTVSKGGMASSQALTAIITGMSKQFKGGMEAQSKTLLGIWATVRENMTGVMRQIGEAITKGFDLEKTFGRFSKWLTAFTVEIDKSGFKQALKTMVPDSVKLALIGIASTITARLIPALVLAWNKILLMNSGLLTLTVGMGAATFGLTFLITEFTGYTNVIKTAIEKTKDWFSTWKENRKILKGIGTEEIARRLEEQPGSIWGWKEFKERDGKKAAKTKTESPEKKAAREAKERDEALKESLATLTSESAAAEKSNAIALKAQQAQDAFKNLAREAKNTSKSIEHAWLEMTGSQKDILDSWHKDQLEELEKSKDANQNYQRDKTRLEETYQEKLRQLLNAEAKERAETIKGITDSYKGMYDKLSEMGLKGSGKDIFNLKKVAEDDIKAMSDYFAKLTAEYTAATAAQKKNILDGIKEAGIEYKLTVSDMLDFSTEKAQYEAERFKQLQNDKINYYRQCKDIQAEIDEAYNQLSLERLQKYFTEEQALRLGNMEAIKVEMDTYVQAMQDAYAPIELMFANMRKTFIDGFGSAISDVIMGVSSLADAFRDLGKSMIKVIVDYYAKQIAARLALSLLGKTTLSAETKASVVAGKAVAKAWSAAAANVSLASFGSNSVPAMAGIAAAHGLTKTLSMPELAEGGLTTGPTIAMIGEGRYKEAVLPLSDKTFDRLADGINKASGQRGNTEINVYGDINSASDEDRIFSELFKNTRFALMGA